MKKVMRIFFTSLGIVLMLLIALPAVLKGKIERMMKDEIHKRIEAHVDWQDFNLNLFKGFPNLSIGVYDCSVVGLKELKGDTLLNMNCVELVANPLSAIKKKVKVKRILLDHPNINASILKNGSPNYDIWPLLKAANSKNGIQLDNKKEKIVAEKNSDDERKSNSLPLSVKQLIIKNGKLIFSNAGTNLLVSAENLNLDFRSNLGADNSETTLEMSIAGLNACRNELSYMRQGNIEINAVATTDMTKRKWTLQENEISVNGLILGAEGSLEMQTDGAIIPDISFYAKDGSFRTLLSIIPAFYLNDFENLETKGRLSLEGAISGLMTDSILPNLEMKLSVEDAYFSYPDLTEDVSDIQMDLFIDYRGDDMDATKIELEEFHLLLGGKHVDMQLNVEHPVSDMHVAGIVKGMVDIEQLRNAIPMDRMDLTGILDADLKWDARMSYIENEDFENVKLQGDLLIEEMMVGVSELPVLIELQKIAMSFHPHKVNLETLDLKLASSDIHLNGELKNFIPYIFKGQTLSGKLNLSSSLLDANELLPENETSEVQANRFDSEIEGISYLPDSLAVPPTVKIPENIDFRIKINMTKLLFEDKIAENLRGEVIAQDGTAILQELNGDVLDGRVRVNGTVDTREEYMLAALELDMLGIDLAKAYESFTVVERMAPMAEYASGNANIKMEMNALLDASFNPLYESIEANGHFFSDHLKVKQPENLKKLSSVLNSSFPDNPELKNVDVYFKIGEGRIGVVPFDIKHGNSLINVSGSHGMDHTMDYTLDMDIAKSDLGENPVQMMGGLSLLARGAGINLMTSDKIKLKVFVEGTYKKPKIKTDFTGSNINAKSE